MTGVEGLQQVEGFGTSDLAYKHAVGSVTERRPKQVPNGHRGYGRLLPPGLEADEIVVRQLQLRCVFDQDNPVGGVDVPGERVEERGLSGRCTATNQNVLAVSDGRP